LVLLASLFVDVVVAEAMGKVEVMDVGLVVEVVGIREVVEIVEVVEVVEPMGQPTTSPVDRPWMRMPQSRAQPSAQTCWASSC